jgi:hypothetical protein
MAINSEPQLVMKFIDFMKLLNVYLNHFPRHEKYGLAQEIRRTAYDVFGMIVEGQKRYHKKTTLVNLDIRHEQMRMLILLANELGYFECKNGGQSKGSSPRRYLVISRLVDELGRMIGGWIKSERAVAPQGDVS